MNGKFKVPLLGGTAKMKQPSTSTSCDSPLASGERASLSVVDGERIKEPNGNRVVYPSGLLSQKYREKNSDHEEGDENKVKYEGNNNTS